jgi:hypothetical protein
MDPSALKFQCGEINPCADARRDWDLWYYLAARRLTATRLCTKLSLWFFGLRCRFQWILAFDVFVSFSNFQQHSTFVLMSFTADRLTLQKFSGLLCFFMKTSSFVQLRTGHHFILMSLLRQLIASNSAQSEQMRNVRQPLVSKFIASGQLMSKYSTSCAGAMTICLYLDST